MNKYIPLSVFFENTRPTVNNLCTIYSAIIRCIEGGEADYIIFHMEYIMYDTLNKKVKFAVDRQALKRKAGDNTDSQITAFLDDIIRTLRYAGEEELKFAVEFRQLYCNYGYVECKKMIERYQQGVKRAHQLLSVNNIVFVCFIVIATVVYYAVYGIEFY